MIGIAWQWRESVFQRNEALTARDRAVREEAAARKAEGEARAARDAAQAARDAAQAARVQAEQNALLAGMQATLALNTIQDLIVQVREKLNGPDLFDIKTALLDSALNRVDGVASVYDKSTSKEATVLAALNELATIYRQLGQSEKAFKVLERCLAIARERVRIKEGSDPSRQNLANILREIASISEEFRRNMKASLAYNEESLKIWEDVFKNPKADQWMLDKKVVRPFLAEAYNRVAVSQYRLGDIALARENFRKAFNLRQELVTETPEDLVKKQDLSYPTMALAETSFRLGDNAGADVFYSLALQQREKMFEAKPKAPAVCEELAGVHYMIGEFKLKTGDLATAKPHLERCRELRAALVEADPKNAIFRRNLGIALYRLGSLADREKNEKAAAEVFETTRKIQQKLVDEDQHNDKRQNELMRTLAQVGQVDKAAEIADRLNAGPNADNEQRLDIARAYAQCARHTPAAQAEKAQTFQVKAVETLRKAVESGFKDYVYMGTEPDLDPIKGRDDFKTLLTRITPAA